MLLKVTLIVALLACTYAATNDDSSIYIINEPRWVELIGRIKDSGFNTARIAFIKSATGLFAFTCKQTWEMVSQCSGEDGKLECLGELRGNIIDPENKQNDIINNFSSSEGKKKASDLLANIVKCKTDGVAPEKFPTIQLPYTSQWNDADFVALIAKLKSINTSDDKLKHAIASIMGRSNGLSSEQVVELYKNIPMTKNLVILSETIKDRLMGVTCSDMVTLLKAISFSEERMEILRAFKSSITDIENKFSILDAWSMSGDKEKARKILEDLKPRSFIFGAPSGKVAFLLDYSGSMVTSFMLNTGKKSTRIDFVKAEFAKTCSNLDPKTTKFDVFAYAERVVAWKPTLQIPTEELIPAAIAFTKQFPANGGTNIYEALRVAWNTPEVDTIYLLTDGSPSVGKTNTDTILAEVKSWYATKKIQVNTIAFLMGTEKWDNKPASRSFMKALADATTGTYRAIESDN